MKMAQMQKDKLLSGQALDSEEAEYNNLRALTRNKMDNLDEFEMFRKSLEVVKGKQGELLTRVVAEMDEGRRECLRQIMGLRKVNNEVRTIFKFRPKK
jgi:hypothetical protein